MTLRQHSRNQNFIDRFCGLKAETRDETIPTEEFSSILAGRLEVGEDQC